MGEIQETLGTRYSVVGGETRFAKDRTQHRLREVSENKTSPSELAIRCDEAYPDKLSSMEQSELIFEAGETWRRWIRQVMVTTTLEQFR